MNTTKKHSRWFLALLLLAAGLAGAMMPQTAAADENGPIGSSGLNYSYTTADKTLTIWGPQNEVSKGKWGKRLIDREIQKKGCKTNCPRA